MGLFPRSQRPGAMRCWALLASAACSVAAWAGEAPRASCKVMHTFSDYGENNHHLSSALFVGHDAKLHGVIPTGVEPGLQAAFDKVLPGTAFRMTPSGQVTLLATFPDYPVSPEPQVAGRDGNYYGTTRGGGRNGAGTFYRMRPHGGVMTLFDFPPEPGCPGPRGQLTEGSDGALYGVGVGGFDGRYANCIFKIRRNGAYTVLQAPLDRSQGWILNDFTRGADGRLYSAAQFGGKHDLGTVIAMDAAGTVQVLHSFKGGAEDGNGPASSLVPGLDGGLYGLTYLGGAFDQGTLYRVGPDGKTAVLHSFGYANDGFRYVSGGLLRARDGNFYGVMAGGGSNEHGGIYRITPAGEFTQLVRFYETGPDCAVDSPLSGLVELDDGEFYGTSYGTPWGDFHSPGAIYRVRLH